MLEDSQPFHGVQPGGEPAAASNGVPNTTESETDYSVDRYPATATPVLDVIYSGVLAFEAGNCERIIDQILETVKDIASNEVSFETI